MVRYGVGDPKAVFVERKTHRESWKGEESVKERVVLQEDKVVPFLEQEYTLDQAKEDLRAKVCTPPSVQHVADYAYRQHNLSHLPTGHIYHPVA